MHLKPLPPTLYRLYCRHFSSTSIASNTVPSVTKFIPFRFRLQAIKQAQQSLTDYLHSTRSLPFTYAELITKNSINSLSELICKVPFDSSNFSKMFQRFLRYNPITEFSFFFESIGIDYDHIGRFLKPNVHFFNDDFCILNVACCLAEFGFPWGKLGVLYVEDVSIFRKENEFLIGRLDGLVKLGFSNQQVVGICLSFSVLLKGEEVELSSEFDAMLDDLKRVLVDFDFGSSFVGNVDVWFEVCRKIKVFYDLGVAKGEVGEELVKRRNILIDFSVEVLVEKVEFFSRLGVEKVEVGLLILSNPEILSVKLNDRGISVSSLLEHFGLCQKQLKSVEQNYKYVLGRNKMVNLPSILNAMNLHKWFFRRMKCGYHQLFASYDLRTHDDGVDECYVQNLESLKNGRLFKYSWRKLEFFHGIGFGENSFAMKLLGRAHGSASNLQERFDFLLNEGIEFSLLCKMISRGPKLFNQDTDSLKKKIDFYLEEIGLPFDYMANFSSYLSYNLEKRIKPRYRFHVWLIEQGWCTKKYTLGTIVGVSHNEFLSHLARIHPTAPQLWLEQYGSMSLSKAYIKSELSCR